MNKIMKYKNNDIYHIDDFRRCYENDSCGHFFDKDALRFFNSKIGESSRVLDETKILFITSEKSKNNPRLYTLRMGCIDDKGSLSVFTVPEFQGYDTMGKVKTAMKNYDT